MAVVEKMAWECFIKKEDNLIEKEGGLDSQFLNGPQCCHEAFSCSLSVFKSTHGMYVFKDSLHPLVFLEDSKITMIFTTH